MEFLSTRQAKYTPVCCGDLLSGATARREFLRLAGGAALFTNHRLPIERKAEA